MAHAPSSVTLEDVPRIVEADAPALGLTARFFLFLLIAVGVLAFAQELFIGNPRQAWMSLHINFLFWLAVAAASSCFAAVFHVCNAQWARPVQRLFESATPFFSWLPLVLVVLYFGHEHLFVWAHEPVPGKEAWLSSNFLFARDLAALLLLVYLARKVVNLSLKRDILAIRLGLTGLEDNRLERWQHKSYDRYMPENPRNGRAEIVKASTMMSRLSPLLIAVFSLSMSLLAFDQLMSVDPIWYSTLFGAFYFMTAVYVAVAFASMGVSVARSMSPFYLAKVERRTLHDLGKLLLGFGIFWAYLFWSHYLTLWYANLPEETGWLILRTREEPWHSIAWMVLGTCFIIPFLLGLNRDLKQVPSLLFVTSLIVAIGVWLFVYILFAPTLYPKELPFSLTDVAIALGFLGAYILSSVNFIAKAPLAPFGDLFVKYEVPEDDLGGHTLF